MLTVSADFLATIRASHGLATSVTAIPPVGDPLTLDIEDGTVTVDRTADHRRRLDLTLSNPLVYPVSASDVVNVFGTEVTVARGIRLAGGAVELIPQGVYRIEEVSRRTPGGEVTVTAWDRSRQVLDQRFLKPRKLAAMQAVELISLLITEVYPDAVIHDLTGDTTTIPKHVVDRDRWPEVQRVAQVIGAEVYADENGEWVIQDIPDPSTAVPVWTIDAGETGVLVSVDDSVTREGAPNGIVTLGESANGNQDPVYGIAHDDNPTSPTLWGGPYGRVPRFYSSPHIKTQAQADKVATKLLADYLGVSRTVSFEAVPNPALDAGDAVQITRPDGSSELHLIDTLTIPLGTGGVMTANTRAVDWGTLE